MKLSVVVPCYNEERTLSRCVQRLLEIEEAPVALEIIIVDDCSTDRSLDVARALVAQHPQITLVLQGKNQGKGAAVFAGFQRATGDFIAVQDADLEYDPQDLKRMLVPLVDNKADVVFGSRFLSVGAHRVLYFWHYLGNYLLTSLSNMFTDLNMTDMESGYKVFRRDVLRTIRVEENRFGFEPEIVAKVAHLRPRIYEIGISYYGRTYEEGKKIGFRDGLRALYCIFKYNVPKAHWFLQFLVFFTLGWIAAAVDLVSFALFNSSGLAVVPSAALAYAPAALTVYFFSVRLVFRHKARWSSAPETILFIMAAAIASTVDLLITRGFLAYGFSPFCSKLLAFALTMVPFFPALRLLIFPEPSSGPWRPQESHHSVPPDSANPKAAVP